jgi:hypothetical protein
MTMQNRVPRLAWNKARLPEQSSHRDPNTSGQSGETSDEGRACDLATLSQQTRQVVDDYLEGSINGVASSCSRNSAILVIVQP